MGSVYKRKRKLRDGTVVDTGCFWIDFYSRGKRCRENTRTTKKGEAERLLKLREGSVASGADIQPRQFKVTVGELLENLLADYQANRRKSAYIVGLYVKRHLAPYFGNSLASHVTTADVNKFILKHQAEGYEPASINKWLSALRRSYSLAKVAGIVMNAPHVPKLKEDNARKGFFEREQYEAIRKHLPEYLLCLFDVAYITGWRKSELLSRQWKHVDFEAKTLRLEPGESKNGEGRTFPFNSELQTLLAAQRQRTLAVQQQKGSIIPWVFHHNGRQIHDYHRAWKTAARAAGQPDRIPHDFRRTAVRNLERSGVSRSVAMKLTGHKTEAVYRRYCIVSESDLIAAVEKLSIAK